MLLAECDGKALFRRFGIQVPSGVVVVEGASVPDLPGKGPWIVKAQVTAGGRGKAGGVARCDSIGAVYAALARMFGRSIGRHVVKACLVEEAVAGSEAYFSVMVDPASAGLRLMYSEQGGMDVESAAMENGTLITERCGADPLEARTALARFAARLPESRRGPMQEFGSRTVELFFSRELILAEVNPLFWTGSGPLAGDAKVVIDLDALYRQPELRDIVTGRRLLYGDAIRKLEDGFDFIDIDPEGSIGLVTTGAGLSMMVIDEIVAQGGRPANFCDVRTGQMRGKPDRLVRIFDWLSARDRVRAVLVNIFAGITDLAEFADLLVKALELSPELRAALVVRIVGNGESAARALLAQRRPDILVHTDLDEAIARTVALARG